MILRFILWTNLTLLLLHEMDAVRTKEWKMMLFINRLNDETASKLFISAHFIIFIIILYMLEYHFMILYWLTCIFFIIHQVIHIIFIRHPMNSINSLFSNIIISAMFLVSIAGLCMAW